MTNLSLRYVIRKFEFNNYKNQDLKQKSKNVNYLFWYKTEQSVNETYVCKYLPFRLVHSALFYCFLVLFLVGIV